MFCNNCGKTIPDGSVFCNFCGSKTDIEKKPRICPNCGADAEKSGNFCGKCGRALPPPAGVTSPAKVLADGQTYRMCPNCGRAITSPDGICYFCIGSSEVQEEMDVGTYTTETAKPAIGGILAVFAGILGIIESVVVYGAVTSFPYYTGSAVCCAGLLGLFGLLAVVGGFFATGRSNFLYAIAGAICGILSFGFGLGSVLAIVGLILIAISKDEFSK